jgi:hypothetical protein
MNWILKLLGYRDREYREDDFSVRIEPIMREAVFVVHIRDGASVNLSGEHDLNFIVVPETSVNDSRHVINVVIECDEGKQFR